MPFFKSKPQPAKPVTPVRPTALSEVDLSKDSLARILRTLGEFCLPTEAYPSGEFAEQCETLASEVLVLRNLTRSGGGRDSSGRDAATLHRDLRKLVRDQRQAESSEYSAHRASAQIVVNDLVENLREALEWRETKDREVLEHLSQLESAIRTGDIDAIRETARSAARQVRSVIVEQRDRDRRRLSKLKDRLDEMKDELEETRAEAQLDGLTELFNRRALDEAVQQAIDAVEMSGGRATVFLVDIDHFKRVNDTWGHGIGDDVLKTVARTLAMSFPRRDDIVGRYGGEEFAALCRGVADDDARNLAERARKAIEALEIPAGDDVIRPTISIGFAAYHRGESPRDTLAAVYDRADTALYRAKRNGRNRVEAG